MGYKSAWIFVVILTIVSAYTDVTMTNCPAQFDIDKYNTTTDTTVATMGALIYASFTSQSDRNQVEEIVVKGDMDALSSYINSMMSPYIIFATIFFTFYIVTVLCCLFDRSCPPCDSIRRDTDSNPYSNVQIRVMMVILLVCASGTLIITIISFSYVPELKQNLDMTDCSIYLALDSAIYGDEKWAGFSNLKDKVESITNLLTDAVTQIQTYFAGNDGWLITSMQAMMTNNSNLYSKYKNSQLITPNPATTLANFNANISVPLIDSLFIKQGLGPNGTAGTMISDIDSGLRVTAKLSQQAYAITQSAIFINSSLSTILNNSASSQNTLTMYNNQLNVSLSQYASFSQKYFHQYFILALSVFQSVFGVVLLGSLVVLFGLVATHCFEVLGCRKMVNLGWTIYGLSYIGVIAVTFFTLSVGSISYNFCNYFNQMLTVQVSYNKLGQAYTQNLFTRMDSCLFGDGNALSKFSLSQEMGTVIKLFTNIQTFFDYTNAVSKNYVNPSISTGKISSWMNAINNYKLGIYDDCSTTITSDDNPKQALKSLNLYTFGGGGVATGSRDVWVWDKTNCTNPTHTIYTAGPTYGTSLSLTTTTCVSFNEKIRSDFTNIWSFSDFLKRYVQIRGNYSNAYDAIKKYGETIINYRDSRINLFNAIYDDLNFLLANNTNYNTQLTNFGTRVNQFYGAVSSLNNLITNSMTGLAVTANCKSLADKMRFVYNVYCINFQAQITKIAMCSLIMLGFMFVGIIAGSRFGMMYYEVERVKRVNMPDQKNSQNHITQLQMENALSTARSEDSDD